MKNNSPIALIVEDDHSWQGILTEILADNDLQTEVCDNLQSAVSKLHSKSYRLAIVDLSLAGDDHNNKDGLEILETIKQCAPNCVSILLTGYASVELAVKVIQEYGAFTCLRKETFSRADFRDVIRQALTSPQRVFDRIASANEIREQSTANLEKENPPAQAFGLSLVIEDDAGWRNLLSELLVEAGLKVQTCASYGEAQGVLKREHFQLAVVDLSLANSLEPSQNQDGYRLLKIIHRANIPTVIVSGSANLNLIDQAYTEHDVYSVMEKQSFDRNAFLVTIKNVLSHKSSHINLTDRELDVLALVAQGFGNKEIASKLFISTNTVKRHLKSIFAKLEVSTRAAASAYAIKIGLSARLKEN